MREQSSSNIKNTHKVFRGGETKVMKKSLVSLLVFALVFTMVAPAFAQVNDIGNSYAKEEIEALIEAGIIGGYEDGTFKPANAITRAEFAKILALSLELEENAAAANVFTDVPAWAKGYVGALVEAELTTGLTATTYGSSQNITREQLATFFVRAFGYEEAAEELDLTPSFNDAANVAPYAKANVAFASEIGFINGLPNGNFDPKGNAQRQAVARLAYEFYFNADEYHAAAEELIQAAQPTLEVTGVKATNLKEIHVDFNQAVAEGSIADANFTLKKSDETIDVSALLADNGTTVILSVKGLNNHLENQGKYTLTVEKVTSTSDVQIEKSDVEFTAFDRELPEVQDVVVTGPRSLDIVFSEPIHKGGKVEVKGENVTVGVNNLAATGHGTNTISVDLFTDLVDGKTYDVTVSEFVDYAGYKNVINVTELEYVKDETAPVATVVKAEQEYVVVKFNKPVSGLTKEHFYHSFTSWTSVNIYKDADKTPITSTDKVSTVYVYFNEGDNTANRPLPEGNVVFVAKAKVGSNEVKDNWGNKFEEATFNLTIVADRTTPAVTNIAVVNNKTLRVTFNKNVKFANSNIEVLNTDGSKIDGVHAVVSTHKASTEFNVDLGKDLVGKTVLVRISDVDDTTVAGNKLNLHTETVTITDKAAPGISKVTFVANATTEDYALYVFYNKAVNSTAIAKANYKFVTGYNAKDFPGQANFFVDNSIVKLSFTKKQWEDFKPLDADHLLVTNVESSNGVKLPGQTYSLVGLNTNAAPVVHSVYATAKDKIQITFDQLVPVVQSSAFSVEDTRIASTEVSTSNGKTVVTLTTVAKYDDAVGIEVTVDPTKGRVENAFGISLAAAGYNRTLDASNDKIAVELAKAVYVDDETIHLEFTKNLDAASFAGTGFNYFSVGGGTLKAVSFDASTNTVVLKGENFSKNSTVSYTGTHIHEDNDFHTNVLKTFSAKQVVEAE